MDVPMKRRWLLRGCWDVLKDDTRYVNLPVPSIFEIGPEEETPNLPRATVLHERVCEQLVTQILPLTTLPPASKLPELLDSHGLLAVLGCEGGSCNLHTW